MLVKLVIIKFNTFDYKSIVLLNYQQKRLQNSIKKRKFFSIKKLKFEPEGNFGARVLFAEYFLLFLLLPPLLLFLHLHAVFVQPPLILHYLQTVFRLFGWNMVIRIEQLTVVLGIKIAVVLCMDTTQCRK